MGWDDEVLGDDEATEDLDAPLTHLDDDDYEAFVQGEFGADGRPRGAPPIGRILLAIVLGLLVVAVLALT